MAEAFDPYYKWIGIHPSERPADYYRLLGINRFESDPEVIAHAADQRMIHLRTFQIGDHSAHSQSILNEIAAAKIVLLSPSKKTAYDRQLRARLPSERAAGAGSLSRTGPTWQTAATVAAGLTLCIAVTVSLLARTNSHEAVPTHEVAPTRQSRNQGSRLGPRDETSFRPARWRSRRPQHERTLQPETSTRARDLPLLPAAGQRAGRGPRSTVPPPGDAPPATARQPEPAELAASDAARRGPPDPPPRDNGPDAAARPAAESTPETSPAVFLDDLGEMQFKVGWGTLGKHGATGYPKQDDEYGQRVVFQGTSPGHALSTYPPSEGSSFVVYGLDREFRTFKVTAAIMEPRRAKAAVSEAHPFYLGKAYSPLTFKVFGDGQLLWQSRPLRKSGSWQDCSVAVEGVRLLELQVHCPGSNAFAWAAWIDPTVLR
jgi:hypothetical protein